MKNVMYLVGYLPRLLWRAFQQHRLVVKTLAPYLGQIADRELVYKIQGGALLISIMALEYASLVDRSIDTALRQSVMRAAALAVLEDTLIDDKFIPESELKRVFSEPGGYHSHALLLQETAHVLSDLLAGIPLGSRDRYLNIIQRVHKAQIHSKDQKKRISMKRLKHITLEKGLALPVFVFPINPQMSDAEVTALQHLGSWLQYMDDVGDRVEDRRTHVRTLFTEERTLAEAFKEVEMVRRDAFCQVAKLPYDHKRIGEYLFGMYFQGNEYSRYVSLMSAKWRWLGKITQKSLVLSAVLFTITTALSLPDVYRYSFVQAN